MIKYFYSILLLFPVMNFRELINRIKSTDFSYTIPLSIEDQNITIFDTLNATFPDLMEYISSVIHKILEVSNVSLNLEELTPTGFNSDLFYYKRCHISAFADIRTLCLSGELNHYNFNHENIIDCFLVNLCINARIVLDGDHYSIIEDSSKNLFAETFNKSSTYRDSPIVI